MNSDICSMNEVPYEVKAASGCNGYTVADATDVVTNILNGVIAVAGIVCVIFIVYGGIQYMTSAGDSSKLTKAKHTVLYAAIGLIICALAFAITNFVVVNLLHNS